MAEHSLCIEWRSAAAHVTRAITAEMHLYKLSHLGPLLQQCLRLPPPGLQEKWPEGTAHYGDTCL
jgi:hypothetical protein